MSSTHGDIEATSDVVQPEANGPAPLPVRGAPTMAPAPLFNTDVPDDVIARATTVATALSRVVESKGLFKVIGNKKHVFVEGWTLLGSMLGVMAVPDGEPEWVEVDGVKGVKATMLARRLDGVVIGGATSYCMRNESKWKSADYYAMVGMAQTRATSRALRQPLGFIMQLAGYEATPAAEMPEDKEPLDVRMRNRIDAVCKEIDKVQQREDGYTKHAVIDQAMLEFGCGIDGLSEDELAAVGTGLARFLNEIKSSGLADEDFVLKGGDKVFADA